MGLLTDFVIAGEDEAGDLATAVRPAERWPTLECKGVEMVKISTLFAAATGTPPDDDLPGSFELAGEGRDEGPWVFRIPENIAGAIAGIAPDELPAVAARWAATEELRLDGWSAGEAAEVIGQLRGHAKKAIEARSTLFLWLSL